MCFLFRVILSKQTCRHRKKIFNLDNSTQTLESFIIPGAENLQKPPDKKKYAPQQIHRNLAEKLDKISREMLDDTEENLDNISREMLDDTEEKLDNISCEMLDDTEEKLDKISPEMLDDAEEKLKIAENKLKELANDIKLFNNTWNNLKTKIRR